MSGHTEGPWRYHKMPDGRYLILNEDTNVAGTAHEGFGPQSEAIELANARLIAAAPLLRETLEEIVAVLDSPEMTELWGQCLDLLGAYDGPRVDMDKARAALAASADTGHSAGEG